MDTERWHRVGDIFERVLSTPPEQRQSVLQSLCNGDPELQKLVVSMLDSQEAPRRADAFRSMPGESKQTQAADPLAVTDAYEAGARIGPWRLVSKIGTGGMGVVWLAERADGQFRQRAALKLIKRGMDSEAVLGRFLRERQILARLDHPNIAHLLDGGITPDGRPYFAMEYVEGLPLLTYCAEHELKLEERLGLFLGICAAIKFAHAQHVVHRDIKPSNILVTANGGIKLLDFGIAKLLQADADDDTGHTLTQREQPMTPAYAAPEQIAGGEISVATDVYALGGVFYELLSGRRPHDFSGAADAGDVLKIILATDPVAPGRLKLDSAPVPPGRLRGDLDTIALTALKQMPARRYPSVAAFAADIDSYLAGEPIAARPDHTYRMYKFFRRHSVGIGAWAAGALIAGLAVALVVRGPVYNATGAALAVVDFSNLEPVKEPHGWVASVVSNMLATELTQGGAMRVLPDDQVRNARAAVPEPGPGGYSAVNLAAIRKQTNADFVLSGSYFVSGQGNDAVLRINITMQDARAGTTALQTTRSGVLQDLPALIAATGEELRQTLHIAPPSTAVAQQTRRAQPPSIDVAKHMGAALDALHRYDGARAKNEFLEATAVAPDYAPAHLYLAQAWNMLGYDSKELAEAERAAAHSEGLPANLRLEIERELAVAKHDLPKAIEFDRKGIALDRGNPELYINLINDLIRANKAVEAAAALAEMRNLPNTEGDPRIERKEAQIANLRNDQHARAQHAELGLRLAQARNQREMAARLKQDAGDAYDSLGERDMAEQFTRAAIADYAHLDQPSDEASARYLLAIILGRRGQLQEQIEEFQRALEINQRIGNLSGIARAYAMLGWGHWKHGDYDAAQVANQHALRVQREIGDLAGQAQTLSALANLAFEQSASDEVIAQLREAMELAHHIDRPDKYLDTLRQLVEVLRERGELDQAQTACAEVGSLLARTTDAQLAKDAEFECAATALERGDVDAALAGFTRARQAALSVSNDSTLGLIDVQLARLDMAQSDWNGARKRLQPAISKFEQHELIGYETVAQSLLACVEHKLDHATERDRAAQRARLLSARVTSRYQTLLAEIELARLQGETSRPPAIEQLQRLASEAEKRRWLARALDARFAVLQLLEKAQDPAAAGARVAITAAARQHGFGWLLARLGSSPAQ